MVRIKFSGVYHTVSNFDLTVSFYEQFLGSKARRGFKDRWAEFEEFGLLNKVFDERLASTEEFWKHTDEKYRSFIRSESAPKELGQSRIITFITDDIQGAYDRVKALLPPPQVITEVMFVNFSTPYQFFQFVDPSGLLNEVFWFPPDTDGV